ncbi:MAG: hypothetical protein ACE5HM_03270 [Acidiferrobacterales bacterium]
MILACRRACKASDDLCRWARTSVPYVLASIVTVVIATESMAQGPWHYKLGQLKSNQQVNLCTEKQDVIRLAKIFENEGARPGYAALTQTNSCSMRMASFTPIKIVRQVMIKQGDVAKYAVSFVKVRTMQGDVQYLVTTRQVKKD